MLLGDFRKQAAAQFRSLDFDSPELEADLILEEVTGLHMGAFPLYEKRPLTPAETSRAETYLKRRLANEPYQYVFGHAEFRNLSLQVRPGCLIPRPETEYLLDFILKELPENACVCELGVGSGAISLALATERPDLHVFGSELSPDAYRIASENLARTKSNNVSFRLGDLFEPFDGMRFDAVAANLPYIPERERQNLPANVRDHEPDMALFAGADGMDVIRKAVLQAPAYLKPGAGLYFEIGEDQGRLCLELAEKCGCWQNARIIHDQYGVDRYFFAQFARSTCPA